MNVALHVVRYWRWATWPPFPKCGSCWGSSECRRRNRTCSPDCPHMVPTTPHGIAPALNAAESRCRQSWVDGCRDFQRPIDDGEKVSGAAVS